uniref:Transcription factor bHLH13 n=1 Tax=Nothapodytes nimmoniana TaxID=159386 RepID=A0A9E9C1J7_NOTNI|nr:transcription factor bHLH13 [Nothapodytes nimmoniana]
MLALSPPSLFNGETSWLLDQEIPIMDQQINFYGEIQTPSPMDPTFLHSSSSLSLQPQIDIISETTRFGYSNSNVDAAVNMNMMVKKLTHNASERDRRKRINGLYASLRSLLPALDKTRKISMPSTVSRVVKYIPELQEEVEMLIRKKEELLSIISRQGGDLLVQNQRNNRQGQETVADQDRRLMAAVSINSVGDREIAIQLSTTAESNTYMLSYVSQNLEEDGFDLLNANSFQTFGERVFYGFHVKVQDSYKIEIDMLREKLMPLFRMGE